MPSGHPDLDFSVYPQSELMTGRQRGESWKASKLLQSHYQNSSPPKLNNFSLIGVGSQLSMHLVFTIGADSLKKITGENISIFTSTFGHTHRVSITVVKKLAITNQWGVKPRKLGREGLFDQVTGATPFYRIVSILYCTQTVGPFCEFPSPWRIIQIMSICRTLRVQTLSSWCKAQHYGMLLLLR